MGKKKDQSRETIGDLLGNPTDAELEELIGDLLKEQGVNIDTDGILDRLRISAPVSYGAWADMLEGLLNWELHDYNEAAEYLQPFACVSYAGKTIPLFATSLGYSPGDDEDDMAEEIFEQIEERTEDAVLLFKAPLIKKIRGRCFSYFGRLLWDGAWHDVLLNQHMKGFGTLIDKVIGARLNIEQPPDDLEDDDHNILARSISLLLAGYDEDSAPNKTHCFQYRSGWGLLVFS